MSWTRPTGFDGNMRTYVFGQHAQGVVNFALPGRAPRAGRRLPPGRITLRAGLARGGGRGTGDDRSHSADDRRRGDGAFPRGRGAAAPGPGRSAERTSDTP